MSNRSVLKRVHQSMIASHPATMTSSPPGDDSSGYDSSDEEADSAILAGVAVPDPVFFCSIEPPSLSYQVMRNW